MVKTQSKISSVPGFKGFISRIFRQRPGGGQAWDGAKNSRTLANWSTSMLSIDEDIKYDIPELRYRSRDLFRNNTIGRGAIQTMVNSVVGSGLRLHCDIDREVLGLSDDEAERIETELEQRFSAWADTNEADAQRILTFGEIQALAYNSKLQSGDVFATLPLIPRAGSQFKLRVKLIESDLVATPPGEGGNKNVIEGVRVDDHGAPISYFIQISESQFAEVMAYGPKTARQNVVHLFTAERPSQHRGVPYLAPVMTAIKNIGRYQESELLASVVASYFTAFVKSSNPEALAVQFNVVPGAATDKVSDQGNDYTLGPGAVMQLAPGEDVVMANPTRPNTGYEQFVRAIETDIGMALNQPYEILLKRYDSSYSASRAARLDFHNGVMIERSIFADRFCQPIFIEWLFNEVVSGKINLPGFLDSHKIRNAWLRNKWVGSAMGQIDETKEVEAAAQRIKHGFSTRQDETMKMNGSDYKRNAARLKIESGWLREVPSIENEQ